jgi:hypothetical protein
MNPKRTIRNDQHVMVCLGSALIQSLGLGMRSTGYGAFTPRQLELSAAKISLLSGEFELTFR